MSKNKDKNCCSFCGRPVDDGSAGKVIAGMDNSLICEHCVAICNDMLNGGNGKKAKKAQVQAGASKHASRNEVHEVAQVYGQLLAVLRGSPHAPLRCRLLLRPCTLG